MHYILSEEADRDLETIFDFGCHKFGVGQATNYLLELETTFNRLALHQQMGRQRSELKQGLVSFVKEAHIIFYVLLSDQMIRVVRVLHASQDIPHYFGHE